MLPARRSTSFSFDFMPSPDCNWPMLVKILQQARTIGMGNISTSCLERTALKLKKSRQGRALAAAQGKSRHCVAMLGRARHGLEGSADEGAARAVRSGCRLAYGLLSRGDVHCEPIPEVQLF